MVTTIISDFGQVILLPKDPKYTGELNPLHRRLSRQPDYDIQDHFRLDYDVLRYFYGFKGKFGLYIYTSGTMHEDIGVKPQLEPIFDGIISAEQCSHSKRNPACYLALSAMLGGEPENMVFIDDSAANIEAARSANFRTVQYRHSLEQLMHDVDVELHR